MTFLHSPCLVLVSFFFVSKRPQKNHKSRGWVALHIGPKFLKNKK